MIDSIKQYKRALKRNLRCSRRTRERLLEKFNFSLAAFLEDTPAPGKDEIYAAFGPPKEMADTLMAEVAPEEFSRYCKNKIIIGVTSGILVSILATVLLFFSLYIYIIKQTPVEFHDAVYIEVEENVSETYAPYTGE